MKRVLPFLLAVTLAACSGGGVASEQALRQANEGYDRALLAGDRAALARIYADDYRYIGDDGEVRGKEEQISRSAAGEVQLLSAKSDDIAVTMIGDDGALVSGRFRGTFRAGPAVAGFTERYTTLWVREGDAWRLKHEHASLIPHTQAAVAN
jgi:ketosteroid isomerase-like protein